MNLIVKQVLHLELFNTKINFLHLRRNFLTSNENT